NGLSVSKRILKEVVEIQIDKINNTCRRTILETVKGVLEDEYEEVLKDPVFGPILAIRELFPFISHIGNNDVVDNVEFIREDEKNDERVEEDVEVEDVTKEPSVVAKEPTVVAEEPIVRLRMAYQFPKRILEEGAEIQIDKINNTYRRTILDTVKGVLEDEYEEVLKDPVFGPILAIRELFPFISHTRNNDVVDNVEFIWEDEKNDERVEEDVEVEDVTKEPSVVAEEPAVVAKGGKQSLLIQTFIEGLFTSSFNSLKELVQKDIQERFDKSPDPSAAKGKGKGKAAESLPPPTVHIASASKKDVQNSEDDMIDFLKNMSQSSNI
ncbi:hypothetical protein IGI04_025746, partial [Brassica rapa subsp. trilocularis]